MGDKLPMKVLNGMPGIVVGSEKTVNGHLIDPQQEVPFDCLYLCRRRKALNLLI